MKQVFKLLYKSSFLLGMLFMAGTIIAATPGKREFSKTINKQFKISSTGTVDLSNKYGQINIKTWDQDAVRISVKIIVNAKQESDAQAQFDRIEIEFSNSPNRVSASTDIESKSSSWWNWNNSCDDFSIDYEIFMPASASIEVDAKYCNLYVAAISGSAEMNVKYGNIKVDALGEDSQVELHYGNGYIGRVRDLDIDLAYGNLDIGESSDLSVDIRYGNLTVEQAGDIICDSRYSNFQLGEIREFRNDGRYDNIEISSVEELVCDAHYSGIKVGSLIRRMNLDMTYGSVKVGEIVSGFDEINIAGHYTDFKLYLASNTACNIDVMTVHADVRLPSNNINKTFDARDNNSHEVRASLNGGGSALIKASIKYGEFVLGRN